MPFEMAYYSIQQLRSSSGTRISPARVRAFPTNDFYNTRDNANNSNDKQTITSTRKDLVIFERQQRTITPSPCCPPSSRSSTLAIKSALLAAFWIGCLVSFRGNNKKSQSNSLFVAEELTVAVGCSCSTDYPPSPFSLLKSFAHSKCESQVTHNDLCHHFGVFSKEKEEEEVEESWGRLFFKSNNGLFDLPLPSSSMLTSTNTNNHHWYHLFFGSLVRFAEASPPLSKLELNRLSDHVFAGRVIEVERKPFVDYADPSRIESHYRLTVEVERVLKTVQNSSSHTAVYWNALPVKKGEHPQQKNGNGNAIKYEYFSTEINEALQSTTGPRNEDEEGKKKNEERLKEIVYVVFSVIAPSERELALRSQYLSKVRKQREAMIGGSMRMGWRNEEEKRKKLFNTAEDELSEEEEEQEETENSGNADGFATTGMDFFARNSVPAFPNDVLGSAAAATADPYVLLSEYGNSRDEDAADIPKVNETRIFFTTFFGQKRHQFTSTFPFEGLGVPYSYLSSNTSHKKKDSQSGSSVEAPAVSSTRRRAMAADPDEDDDDVAPNVRDDEDDETEQQARTAEATTKVAPNNNNNNAYNGVILTTKRQRESIRLAEQQAPTPVNGHGGDESEVLKSSLDVKKKKGVAASSGEGSLDPTNVAPGENSATNNKKPQTQAKSEQKGKKEEKEKKPKKVTESNVPATTSSSEGRRRTMNVTTGGAENAAKEGTADFEIVFPEAEAPGQQAKSGKEEEVTSLLHMFVDPRRPKTYMSLQPNGMLKLVAKSGNMLGDLTTTTTTSTTSPSSIVDKLVEAYYMTSREMAEEEAKEREKMRSGGGGRLLGGGGHLFIDESALAGDSFALRVTREREKKERDIRVARRWKRSQSRSKSKSRSQIPKGDHHIAHDEGE